VKEYCWKEEYNAVKSCGNRLIFYRNVSPPYSSDTLLLNVHLLFLEAGSNTPTVAPASRRKQRKGKTVPGGITRPPCSWRIQIRGRDPLGWEGGLESERLK
jgi:hypothetical protein